MKRPISIYTAQLNLDEFSQDHLKLHFGITHVRHEPKIYMNDVIHQKIEFEREKLRKLKEVFLISVDKTKKCQFFVRDYVEYIKRVLGMQKNVNKMRQVVKGEILEKGFAESRLEGGLTHRIEGIERTLFIMECIHPDTEGGVDNELHLLKVFAKLQMIN